MTEHNTDDVRRFGGIDLATIQRYLNLHYSISLDLFGQEMSTNAANYYTMGLKGRFRETNIADDHVLSGESYPVLRWTAVLRLSPCRVSGRSSRRSGSKPYGSIPVRRSEPRL